MAKYSIRLCIIDEQMNVKDISNSAIVNLDDYDRAKSIVEAIMVSATMDKIREVMNLLK